MNQLQQIWLSQDDINTLLDWGMNLEHLYRTDRDIELLKRLKKLKEERNDKTTARQR